MRSRPERRIRSRIVEFPQEDDRGGSAGGRQIARAFSAAFVQSAQEFSKRGLEGFPTSGPAFPGEFEFDRCGCERLEFNTWSGQTYCLGTVGAACPPYKQIPSMMVARVMRAETRHRSQASMPHCGRVFASKARRDSSAVLWINQKYRSSRADRIRFTTVCRTASPRRTHTS